MEILWNRLSGGLRMKVGGQNSGKGSSRRSGATVSLQVIRARMSKAGEAVGAPLKPPPLSPAGVVNALDYERVNA